jgi:hypothetical protein
MLVSQLITAAFGQASQNYPEVRRSWTQISFRVGGLLPNSFLFACVQREDETAVRVRADADDNGEFHFQCLLSEMWIGTVYETLRLLNERKLAGQRRTLRFRA